MLKKFPRRFFAILILPVFFVLASIAHAQDTQITEVAPKGKNPLIIIPGITGSELINSKTDELVWIKTQRAKDDDIRLPISANLEQNRDDLVAGNIIRTVKLVKFLPEAEIYERLIEALTTRGGYREASWTNPKKGDYQDSFYVFPYDWRRDNVENARLLMQKIATLKRQLGKRNLKFNVIAHSMGGLIARYAAMYGDADLSNGKLKPTWSGARNFDKIFLLGTPNEGSILSLKALLSGLSYIGGGLNLPFIRNIDRFDVFTIPAIYQLLPHDGTFMAYDENLKPLAIDLYDVNVWEKYGWTVWQDKDFKKKLSANEQRNAKAYFQAVLGRAKRFQSALDANTRDKLPVSIYLMGADCKETQNAVLLLRDEKKNTWKVQFKADSFKRKDGTKVTGEELKSLLFAMGDSVVTQRSLKAQTVGNKRMLPVTSELYQCVGHSKLVSNPEIQDKLLSILFGTSKAK